VTIWIAQVRAGPRSRTGNVVAKTSKNPVGFLIRSTVKCLLTDGPGTHDETKRLPPVAYSPISAAI